MKNIKHTHLRLLGNFPSRSASNLQFYSDQIPFRKALGEIQENMLEDSFSFLEEGTPRHVPTSRQKASINLKRHPDLDKTIIQDTTKLLAVRKDNNKKPLPLPKYYKKDLKDFPTSQHSSNAFPDLFGAIIKGDISYCISYLNKW